MIFISARVHPGEVPGSHIMKGLLDFLTPGKTSIYAKNSVNADPNAIDPRAMALLNHFVIKIVPMLNPDGVARGHYRFDTLGQNLNRHYDEPDWQRQPAIYAVKEVIKQIEVEYGDYTKRKVPMVQSGKRRDYPVPGQLYLYMDLHAHAGKRGAFIYGNHFEDIEDQAQAMLYPRLIAANTLNFDFGECNFTEKLMLKKDKKGVSREGAGRVAMHRECPGLVHSYTLEANYCCGGKLNALSERFDLEKRRFLAEIEPVTDASSTLYAPYPRHKQDQSPMDTFVYQARYSSTIFSDIGRACMVAVLDLIYQNPQPRVQSVQQLKGELLYRIMEDRENATS